MKINLGIAKKLSNFIFENMDAMFFYVSLIVDGFE